MNSVKTIFFILACFFAATINAQEEAVVLTVDSKPVTSAEFEAIYKKNNKDADVTKEALDEYMELFINYKLKVREAESLGMDTISKFQKELAGYRTQLARPYLIDRELNESLLKEAYERKQSEVRASHILVQIQGAGTPADTLAAWNKIQKLYKRVTSGGEDFGTVAKDASEDPSAKSNSGDLGYFTALQMVYPFENGAFNTPLGEVSQPVRTRFGYHLMKVADKRPARGEIKTAHIMIRSVSEDDEVKKADAKKRINEVYELLMADKEAFADLALKYSEDPGSSAKGGALPKFGTGKMVEEFENAAFALKADGDISQPFTTQYGWHIVKRMEYEPIASFDEMKGQLKSSIAKDSRAEMTKKSFIAQLKKDYGYVSYPKNLSKIAKKKLLSPALFTKGNSSIDTVLRLNANLGEVMIDGKGYDRQLNGVFKSGQTINARSRQYTDIAEVADDTIVVRQIAKGWAYDRAKASKFKKPLFSLNGKHFTQTQFLDYLEKNQKSAAAPEGTWQQNYLNEQMAAWVDEEVIKYEDAALEGKYPEFRLLMKEYRDGILLFELTDEKVWSKAVSDSTGLAGFYDGNKNDFMWPKRWDATIYKCDDKKVAQQVRRMLQKGTPEGDILSQVNKKSSLALSVETDIYDAEEKPFLSGLTALGLSNNIDHDGQVVFANVREVLDPRAKELSEARGMITAAYQDHLEKEWIAQLRSKYTFKVNNDVLYSIK